MSEIRTPTLVCWSPCHPLMYLSIKTPDHRTVWKRIAQVQVNRIPQAQLWDLRSLLAQEPFLSTYHVPGIIARHKVHSYIFPLRISAECRVPVCLDAVGGSFYLEHHVLGTKFSFHAEGKGFVTPLLFHRFVSHHHLPARPL